MIFEKPSLRTRLSFETGMTQLGGHAIYLGPSDIGLGKREKISDIAIVTASMVDVIMARTFVHATVVELAKYSKVPVINGLSDLEHPCQILADLLTIWEIKGKLKGLTIGYIGDGENNVSHSLYLAASQLDMKFQCAAPKGYWLNKEIVEQAGGQVLQTDDPKVAAANADVVYTDTWVSMGDELEKNARLQIFQKYQVDDKLMKLAKNNAIFMHDLPAYRGNEVTSEVIDGPQSAVFQQAENRLHAQKGLLVYLLKKHGNTKNDYQ